MRGREGVREPLGTRESTRKAESREGGCVCTCGMEERERKGGGKEGKNSERTIKKGRKGNRCERKASECRKG